MGEVIHDSIIEGHIVYLEEGDNTSVIIKEELNSDFIDEEYEQDENFQETSDLGRCLVCKSIEKFPNEHLDIFIQSTTASKNSAANVISTMMMKRSSADVTFNNTSICSKCFKLLNRADELQVIFQDIKRELRDIKEKFRSCLDIGNIEPDDESTNYKVKNENIKEEESLSDNKDESIEFNLDEPWENIEIASPKKTKKKKKIKRKINDENENDQNNVKKKTKVKTGTTPLIKGHVCKICGLELRYKQTMDHHMRTAHSEDAGSTCTLCRVKFSTDLELQQHNEKCHMPVELMPLNLKSEDMFSLFFDTKEERKCRFCDINKVFSSSNDLIKHFLEAHGPYGAMECVPCATFYMQGINTFLNHVIFFHRVDELKEGMGSVQVIVEDEKSLENGHRCIKCLKYFPSLEQLISHRITHRDKVNTYRKDEDKKAMRLLRCKCPLCPKIFAPAAIMLHVNDAHTSALVLKCPKCDLVFDQHKHIRYHKYTVHNLGHLKNFYECHICHKHYGKAALQKHINTIHENKKDFMCEVCGKEYGYKSHLDKHVLTHSSVGRKFRCKLCGNIYSDVRKHLKMVHKLDLKNVPRIRNPLNGHLVPYERVNAQDFADPSD